MRNVRNNSGFTLIELMIVVVIIGILAAIAIPKFSSFSDDAREREAMTSLKGLHTLQEMSYTTEGPTRWPRQTWSSMVTMPQLCTRTMISRSRLSRARMRMGTPRSAWR